MTTVPAAPLMTADELLALPEKPGMSYELVRGELRCMAPSVALPGVVSAKALIKLGSFVDQHDLGICGTAESGFKLESEPDTVRAPDAWFVRKERIPAEGIPRSSGRVRRTSPSRCCRRQTASLQSWRRRRTI